MNHPSDVKNTQKNYSENFSENRMYYEKLANKYHILKYAFIIFLIGFVLLTFFFGYRSMQISNFRYLIKTLNINPVSLETKYSDITYAAGKDAKFTLFKNDLAVIGDGKTTLYDLSGQLCFRDDMKNSGKSFTFSEKYMAVYTPGEKSLSLYNSFSLVFETSVSSPINFVAVSDTGNFAVCFKDDKQNAIEIWNENFEKEIVFYVQDGMVFDMDFSPNGDKLSITLLATENGNYFTKILLWDISEEEFIFEEQIDGKKPLASGFFLDGSYYSVVEGNIFFYRSNGKKEETEPLLNGEYTVICDGETLMLLQNSSHVMIFSKRGELKNEFKLPEKIFHMKAKDDFYYMFSNTQIAVYDTEGNLCNSYPISSDVLDFFILADNSLLLCYNSETERIVPET